MIYVNIYVDFVCFRGRDCMLSRSCPCLPGTIYTCNIKGKIPDKWPNKTIREEKKDTYIRKIITVISVFSYIFGRLI